MKFYILRALVSNTQIDYESQIQYYAFFDIADIFISIIWLFIAFQTYAVGLCQSFCELLKEITTDGQVQVLKVMTTVVSFPLYFVKLDLHLDMDDWQEGEE